MATEDCSVLDAAAEGGLGYSRHYAQRIRDLGQTSKDGWIKRLWNHMFGSSSVNSKKISVKTEEAGTTPRRPAAVDHVDDRTPPSDVSHHSHTTESNNHVKKPYPHQVTNADKHEVILPVGQRQTRSMHDLASSRAIPPQLVNSPYLPSKEKVVYYRPVLTAKPGGSHPRDGVVAAKLRFQRLSKSSTTLRGSSHQHAVDASSDVHHKSSSLYPVRRQQFKRDSTVIQMEKRAKAVADRAITVRLNVCFRCTLATRLVSRVDVLQFLYQRCLTFL